MMIIELAKELLKLINCDIIATENIERIKNLICYISENKRKSDLSDIQQLQANDILYRASLKMRTFGYNTLNKFDRNTINACSDKAAVYDESLLNFYRATSNTNWFLDKRQKEVVDCFNSLAIKRLFLSAPTSFGKTFLLKEIILTNKEQYKTLVIILPTIALLQEVTTDLKDFCNTNKLQYKIVNSVYFLQEENECRIMILTPERVLQIFALDNNFKPDFFFFDEIYKIDEDISNTSIDGESLENDDDNRKSAPQKHSRGVAFRIALYLLSKNSNDFYIAGPFIELDSLGSGFERFIEKFTIHKKQIKFEPTLKNRIEFTGKTYRTVSAISGEKNILTNCENTKDRCKYLKEALYIDGNNQTIFYVLNPAHTYDYALSYAENENDNIGRQRFIDFLEHLQKTYSLTDGVENTVDNWSLFKVLKKGIGIHNGKLPRYIQKEVMKLFNNKEINVLFCTSTIIEGVNTNAKNIVLIHNPTGKSNSGKRFSLLNINGRAGRYIKHFVGTVVYLNSKQKSIEQSQNIVLDFKSYSTESISNLDLENIDCEDLTQNNTLRKQSLEKNFNINLLPDETFFKNRLIERKVQENFLSTLLKDEWFEKFELLTAPVNDILSIFMKNSMIKSLTNLWANIGQIHENEAKKYNSICVGYALDNYLGVLKKQYKYEKAKGEVNFDKLYAKIFSDIKKIVEYEIPKIMSLFQTLFNRALVLKDINKQIDMLPIIRYYELGVKSEIGAKMIEWGIPVMTVKKVEKVYGFRNQSLENQMEHWNRNANLISGSNAFDGYEQTLLANFYADSNK